jgi:hypothetical protein
MHASPAIKDLLIPRQNETVVGGYSTALFEQEAHNYEARRNYLKLVRRHKALAAAHRLTEEAACDDQA